MFRKLFMTLICMGTICFSFTMVITGDENTAEETIQLWYCEGKDHDPVPVFARGEVFDGNKKSWKAIVAKRQFKIVAEGLRHWANSTAFDQSPEYCPSSTTGPEGGLGGHELASGWCKPSSKM